MSSIPITSSKIFRNIPKYQLNIKFIHTKAVFLPIFLMLLVAVACGDSGPEIAVVVGRSLELHTTYPEIVEQVAFTDTTGQHRVIRPRATNRQLIVTNVTIVNRTSLFTPLLIDSESAQLGDRRGERIDALDPFEASRLVETAGPDENKYTPMLWGEVNLDREFQVDGWMVFDVPKGLILGSLWWEEVDSLIADFISYQQRRR